MQVDEEGHDQDRQPSHRQDGEGELHGGREAVEGASLVRLCRRLERRPLRHATIIAKWRPRSRALEHGHSAMAMMPLPA